MTLADGGAWSAAKARGTARRHRAPLHLGPGRGAKIDPRIKIDDTAKARDLHAVDAQAPIDE
jgi:hypothetical protein